MNDNKRLINIFASKLDKIADKETKDWWENYIKHSTKFRGVGIPKIRDILEEWHKEEQIDKLPPNEQLELALSFFAEDYAEDKLAGILFLQYYLYDKFDWKLLLNKFDKLFVNGYIYDWNICDWFCVRVLGPIIKENGLPCAKVIFKWNNAKNVWQARCSVVAFANLTKERKFTPLLLKSCSVLIKREERFAKTGVGWILRELSKTDKNSVVDFINKDKKHFSKESLTNSIKYFNQTEKAKIKNNL
jgi:3-methyladenine DNA glycosylase AlkD